MRKLTRQDLPNILYEAIKHLGGQATIIDACKYIWAHYEQELRSSGDLFYKWQYDIRWAAIELRRTKRMKPADQSPRGVWEII